LTAKQIKDRLSDLEKLPPLPGMADKLDLGERFLFLDSVMMVDRYGVGFLEDRGGGGASRGSQPGTARLGDFIDWEPALRKANRWYDRVAAAMRVKDREAREEQLGQLVRELGTLKAKHTGTGAQLKLIFARNPARARGEAI